MSVALGQPRRPLAVLCRCIAGGRRAACMAETDACTGPCMQRAQEPARMLARRRLRAAALGEWVRHQAAPGSQRRGSQQQASGLLPVKSSGGWCLMKHSRACPMPHQGRPAGHTAPATQPARTTYQLPAAAQEQPPADAAYLGSGHAMPHRDAWRGATRCTLRPGAEAAARVHVGHALHARVGQLGARLPCERGAVHAAVPAAVSSSGSRWQRQVAVAGAGPC